MELMKFYPNLQTLQDQEQESLFPIISQHQFWRMEG